LTSFNTRCGAAGVHANSLTKYERDEGKPHAAVVRIFEMLCEKEGIRFDEYEAGQKDKGERMKIVLAEKVSPATLAVFAAEPGWEVLTPRPTAGWFAGCPGRRRCAGSAFGGAG